MGARVLFKVISTGPGDPGRRCDVLEQELTRVADDAERAFDTGGKWSLRSVTGNSAAQPWDFILADPTAAVLTVLIPDPTTCKLARLCVKNDSDSANAITLRPPSGKTIDGASSLIMTAPRIARDLVSDGLEWKTVGGASSGAAMVLDVPFGTANPTTNDVSAVVPSSPSGNQRFVLEDIEVWSSGIGGGDAGTVTLSMGTSAGGTQLLLPQAITSATAAGIQGGLALSSLGASMLIGNGYRAALNAGASIYLRAATTVGSVSAGKSARAYIYGSHLT